MSTDNGRGARRCKLHSSQPLGAISSRPCCASLSRPASAARARRLRIAELPHISMGSIKQIHCIVSTSAGRFWVKCQVEGQLRNVSCPRCALIAGAVNSKVVRRDRSMQSASVNAGAVPEMPLLMLDGIAVQGLARARQRCQIEWGALCPAGAHERVPTHYHGLVHAEGRIVVGFVANVRTLDAHDTQSGGVRLF
jgi:hypothetical protein